MAARLADSRVVIHCNAIADRDRLAGQNIAVGDLLVREAIARGHLDLALGHLRPACRAHAGLASERRGKSRSPCTVEDVAGGEGNATSTAVKRDCNRSALGLRLQLGDLLRHGFWRAVGGEALDMDALL